MISLGFAFGYSDLVVEDEDFPYPSCYLYCGSGGDIVYENTLGQAQYFAGAAANQFLPIAAKRVLSSGTVNGTLYNTTASDIVYCCTGKGV